MVSRNYFVFGGVKSSDYGIYISGSGTYNAPKRAVDEVEIPGKNGTLIIDHGRYENTVLTYPAFTYASDRDALSRILSDFRNAILSKRGYQRLEDTYHTDEYRMAMFSVDFEAEVTANGRAGGFDLEFNCKPQRFLTEGEEPLELIWVYKALENENSVLITNEEDKEIEGATSPVDSITNPTPYESQPLIVVTGSGTVSIGDQIITVTDIAAGTDVYIDSEVMEIYTETGGVKTGASSHVTFNKNTFPIIAPGTQGFSNTAPVQIIPRWWRL